MIVEATSKRTAARGARACALAILSACVVDVEEQAADLFDELGPELALCPLLDLEPTTSLGAALYALERPLEAAGVYGQLLSQDPLTVHNLAASLHDAGLDAEPLFEIALTCAGPHDWLVPRALMGVADYHAERGDIEHAGRIRAQAEDLMEREPLD